MSLAILFHFLCAQHVSDINISVIRSLRLCYWITTSVVLFCKDGWFSVSVSLRCIVVCRKLLMMDILMSETCWAHKKWNKIASDIKLVFHSSSITMMHGPINIRFTEVYILTGGWRIDLSSTWKDAELTKSIRLTRMRVSLRRVIFIVPQCGVL